MDTKIRTRHLTWMFLNYILCKKLPYFSKFHMVIGKLYKNMEKKKCLQRIFQHKIKNMY